MTEQVMNLNTMVKLTFIVEDKIMNKYTFTLEHDNGKDKVSVYAKNLHSAIAQILNNEDCPERAILNINIKYK